MMTSGGVVNWLLCSMRIFPPIALGHTVAVHYYLNITHSNRIIYHFELHWKRSSTAAVGSVCLTKSANSMIVPNAGVVRANTGYGNMALERFKKACSRCCPVCVDFSNARYETLRSDVMTWNTAGCLMRSGRSRSAIQRCSSCVFQTEL